MFIDLPKQAHDLTGKRYGLWAVLGPVDIKRYRGSTVVMWRCKCDCGNVVDVAAGSLKRGLSLSCGCVRNKMTSERRTSHGHSAGGVSTAEYQTWKRSKSRCHNTNSPDYPDYGGRGICVAHDWINDFSAFYAHIGPRPSPKHSIDRIDNNCGYVPGNVRWATNVEQAVNKRNSRRLTINGCTMTVAEWSIKTGVPAGTISRRLSLGWSQEDAIGPVDSPFTKVEITINGKTMNVAEWAREMNVESVSIYGRLRRGWPPEDAVMKPMRQLVGGRVKRTS